MNSRTLDKITEMIIARSLVHNEEVNCWQRIHINLSGPSSLHPKLPKEPGRIRTRQIIHNTGGTIKVIISCIKKSSSFMLIFLNSVESFYGRKTNNDKYFLQPQLSQE